MFLTDPQGDKSSRELGSPALDETAKVILKAADRAICLWYLGRNPAASWEEGMKTLAMVLKIEAVTDDGIVDLKDEADMDFAAQAINAYPKLVAQLRAAAVILKRVEHQVAEHRADIASRAGDVREDCIGLLQELGEQP